MLVPRISTGLPRRMAPITRSLVEGPARKLCTFYADGAGSAFGGEALYADGRLIGATTSAAFGHSVGRLIVNAYVPADLVRTAGFEIECFGERSGLRRAKRRDVLTDV